MNQYTASSFRNTQLSQLDLFSLTLISNKSPSQTQQLDIQTNRRWHFPLGKSATMNVLELTLISWENWSWINLKLFFSLSAAAAHHQNSFPCKGFCKPPSTLNYTWQYNQDDLKQEIFIWMYLIYWNDLEMAAKVSAKFSSRNFTLWQTGAL